MTVSILNLHCLNAVCDDYESLPAILEEVRRSSHGNVSLEEITDSMTELVRDGLVVEKNVSQGTWFLITSKGRSELDANWVDS